MAKKDFENILENIKSLIANNLNTRAAAISTEKGDSITMPSISSDAYFLQTLNENVANYDPFIVYGIESIDADGSIHSGILEKISIYFVIVMADNGASDLVKILFRFQRALKEIVEENFTDYDISNKLLVRRLEPVPFESLDSSAQYKAIGIIVETFLA